MFKKFLLSFFIIFGSLVTIYPSKKENTDLLNYCFSFEKILTRNAIEKSKNVSKRVQNFSKDITLLGNKKTKGALANKIIDQYKNSKKSFIITFVPNQFYCLTGYWIEEISPGTLASILYEKSKQKINKYKDIKNEVDEFINDINLEYESIKKEFNGLF